ncbi:HEPN domain-containing protein [candidate division KSB1 bacterium]|nr:HEPN domain-containing protein [candidate division KSB1 bacterium]
MKAEFLQKAADNLSVARYCFEHGSYDASVTRAYYAAFQAAVAALAHAGIVTEKREHKWLQANFSRELIKRRKVYPGGVLSYLSDMLNVRNIADYSEKFISAKLASRQLAKADELYKLISAEVES